jgi:nucleolar protein TMA23
MRQYLSGISTSIHPYPSSLCPTQPASLQSRCGNGLARDGGGGSAKGGEELIIRIFAATAASIFSPSPSGSGTSTPLSTNVAHSSTRSWTTTTFGQVNPLPKPGTGVSTAARVSKEQARRGLYSRFMRGKVVVPESESESERSDGEGKDKAERSEGMGKGKGETRGADEIKEGVAGPSTPMIEEVVSSKKSKGKGKEVGGETKEEKRVRKAEKAKRKEEKEARRATKSQVDEGSSPIDDEKEGKTSRKRKDLDLEGDGVGKVKKVKKEKKEKVSPNGDGLEAEEGVKKEKVKKEKKKKEKIGGTS